MRLGSYRCVLGLAALLAGAPAAALGAGLPTDGHIPQQYTGFDPNDEYHAGLKDMDNGKYRDAKEHFQHVLLVARDHPMALYRLAQAEAGMGDLRQAVRDYEWSLKQDPHMIDPAKELAIADEHLGRHKDAEAQLQKLKQRAQACGDSCPDAGALQSAVQDVQAAMPADAPTKP